MPVDCAISLGNLTIVPKAVLTEPITQLDTIRIDELCRALARSTGCA
jgi:mRNA-degrading endonuclease toxin of MazEF toxin-antitoxin module